MTQRAHRCQRCGDTFEAGDTRRWCDACPPTTARKPVDPDTVDLEEVARELVRTGLATPDILDGAFGRRTAP